MKAGSLISLLWSLLWAHQGRAPARLAAASLVQSILPGHVAQLQSVPVKEAHVLVSLFSQPENRRMLAGLRSPLVWGLLVPNCLPIKGRMDNCCWRHCYLILSLPLWCSKLFMELTNWWGQVGWRGEHLSLKYMDDLDPSLVREIHKLLGICDPC